MFSLFVHNDLSLEMPKRKNAQATTTTPLPENIETLPLDFKTSARLRTREVQLFAQALNVEPSFLLQHFCSCLNRKITNAIACYDFLYEHENFAAWIRKSYSSIENHAPVFPPAEVLIGIPDLTQQSIINMRALMFLKYHHFEVFFLFYCISPFY